jgi:transcriptional regulator with XRE-family HTH domain
MHTKRRNLNKYAGYASRDLSVVIGNNLRFLRQRAAMSQKEVADILGISYQQMQKYEQGSNRICAEYIYRLKTLYNVQLEDFFTGVKLSELQGISRDDPLAWKVFLKTASIEDQNVKQKICKIVNILSAK